MRTFFLNLAGMASWALRFRAAAFFSRASRSSSFSPSSSSAWAAFSSSSSEESICASEPSSSPLSVKPASSSSSWKRSSRSESASAGSSFASIDFMRLPAVDRLERPVASHSICCFEETSESLSEPLLLATLSTSIMASESASGAIALTASPERRPSTRSAIKVECRISWWFVLAYEDLCRAGSY